MIFLINDRPRMRNSLIVTHLILGVLWKISLYNKGVGGWFWTKLIAALQRHKTNNSIMKTMSIEIKQNEEKTSA